MLSMLCVYSVTVLVAWDTARLRAAPSTSLAVGHRSHFIQSLQNSSNDAITLPRQAAEFDSAHNISSGDGSELSNVNGLNATATVYPRGGGTSRRRRRVVRREPPFVRRQTLLDAVMNIAAQNGTKFASHGEFLRYYLSLSDRIKAIMLKQYLALLKGENSSSVLTSPVNNGSSKTAATGHPHSSGSAPLPLPQPDHLLLESGAGTASGSASATPFLADRMSPDARINWTYACLDNMSLHHGGQGAPWLRPGGRTKPHEVLRDVNRLRHHAWTLHAALGELRELPVMNYNGYSGPWIENHWIAAYARPTPVNVSFSWWKEKVEKHGPIACVSELMVYNASDTITLLQPYDFDFFYPWVPLFAQWEDSYMLNWDAGVSSYGRQVALYLQNHMRLDVQYVTVVQRQSGFVPGWSRFAVRFHNILVLSAGGEGHVALPLLAQELSPLPPLTSTSWSSDPSGDSSRGNDAVVTPTNSTASPQFVFLGKMHHHPVRDRMRQAFLNATTLLGWKEGVDYVIDYQPPDLPANDSAPAPFSESDPRHWKQLMGRAVFNLAPRGTGPTSFRFYEALQMGTVPVYIYDHNATLWLPYNWPLSRHADNSLADIDSNASSLSPTWSDMAVLVSSDRFSDWLTNDAPRLLAQRQWLDKMRATALALRSSHFAYAGIMARIGEFVVNPATSQLRCHVGPPTDGRR